MLNLLQKQGSCELSQEREKKQREQDQRNDHKTPSNIAINDRYNDPPPEEDKESRHQARTSLH